MSSLADIDVSKLSRLEVIDSTGRAYVKWYVELEFSVQDDGRTLKIFVKGRQGEFNMPKGYKLDEVRCAFEELKSVNEGKEPKSGR